MSNHAQKTYDSRNKKLRIIENLSKQRFIKGITRMAKDFTFKQFHIKASECGMPVSTDAILLGAWANIQDSCSILDIGCGTGVLSLMCAQRNAVAQITGVEIEINAFQATTTNYKNSPWKQRLHSNHIDIKHFVEQSVKQKREFEAIICNPPYFNEGEEAQNKQRAMARHTNTLSHLDLLNYCSTLLKENGSAHFVLPKTEGEAFSPHMMIAVKK